MYVVDMNGCIFILPFSPSFAFSASLPSAEGGGRSPKSKRSMGGRRGCDSIYRALIFERARPMHSACAQNNCKMYKFFNGCNKMKKVTKHVYT